MSIAKKKTKNHYIDNQKFLETLIQYQNDVKLSIQENVDRPPIPNYIGDCFIKIAQHLSHAPNFVNYSYRDEMVADAIENCLMYFENFDPEKSKNPFAYFTQIVYYAFIRRISKEKKQQYVKYKSLENSRIFDEMSGEDFEYLDSNANAGSMKSQDMYENMYQFIENYELSSKMKREKVSKKIGLEKFYEGEKNGWTWATAKSDWILDQ